MNRENSGRDEYTGLPGRVLVSAVFSRVMVVFLMGSFVCGRDTPLPFFSREANVHLLSVSTIRLSRAIQKASKGIRLAMLKRQRPMNASSLRKWAAVTPSASLFSGPPMNMIPFLGSVPEHALQSAPDSLLEVMSAFSQGSRLALPQAVPEQLRRVDGFPSWSPRRVPHCSLRLSMATSPGACFAMHSRPSSLCT